MEYLIGIIIALVGAVFFFKKQSDTNKRDAVMGQTEGQDKILKENQEAVKRIIEASDTAMAELAEEREKQRKEYEAKTRAERADAWNKKND